jgi:GT2 family glycosyltransferase
VTGGQACSVIVPTRGRPEQLRACLESLCGSDYDRSSLEIVVVDDGGRQQRAVEAAVSSVEGRVRVVLLRTEGLGPAAARNVGAQRAGGTLLAFTDDDCRVESDWLALLADAVGRSDGGAAGGRTLNGLPDNRWAVTSQRIVDLVYAHYNEAASDAEFLATNNLAVPADAFQELGGFDERYALPGGEDRAFCLRWRASGRVLLYEPRALVEHAHPLTLAGFLRQHFAYGRGAYRFHRDARQVRESAAFHAALPRLLAAGVPAGPRRTRELTATVGGLVLWEAGNAAGVAYEAVASAFGRAKSPGRNARGGRAGGGNTGHVMEDVEADTDGGSADALASE